MMKTTRFNRMIGGLLLVAAAVLAVGCEETADITDAAYVERLVIHGVLEPDSAIAVTVRRTLPLDVRYDSNAAAVSDAEVVIEVRDRADQLVDRLTLTHSGGAIYRTGTAARSGFRYRLSVRWRAHRLTASTQVPDPITIDSARAVKLDSTEHEMFGWAAHLAFRPRPGQAYVVSAGAVDERMGGQPIPHRAYGGAPIYRTRDTNEHGWISVTDSSATFPEEAIDRMVVIVMVYDAAYYDFYRTYYTYEGGGPFSTGADLVRWNIDGDGIGLFIGRRMVWRKVEM